MSFSIRMLLTVGFLTLLVGLTEGVKCTYCNNDFVSLGRHVWRCKARCTATLEKNLHKSPEPSHTVSASILTEHSSSLALGSADDECTCVCGRKCVGRRGLRAHERSCAVLKSLMKRSFDQGSQQLSQPNAADSSSTPLDNNPFSPSEPISLNVKPGLKLSKTAEQWTEANLYFKLRFSSILSSPLSDLNKDVARIQDDVYNYFADTWGTLSEASGSDFTNKYNDKSAKSLQISLKLLKNIQIAVRTVLMKLDMLVF